MLRKIAVAAAFASALIAPADAHADWTSYDRPAQYSTVTDKDVPITMSDGIHLYADVIRPDKPGRYPVLLEQTPYNKNAVDSATAFGDNSYFAQRGYVVVIEDVRGTGSSEGQWQSFDEREQRDGFETVQWAAAQPWSDGKVGLFGPSYMGLNQLFTAAQHPKGLKAIFPVVPMADGYRDITYSGGEINTGFIPLWLGLVTGASLVPPSYALDGNPADLVRATTELAGHASGLAGFQLSTVANGITGGDEAYDGPFWKTRSPIEVLDNVNVPAFVVGGLHDLFQRGEPLVYERLKRHVNTRLLIGPWTHVDGSVGKGLPGNGVPESLSQIELRWFDHYLKGMNTDIAAIPKVTQWAWGNERFETQADWPDPRLAPTREYLRAGKQLSPSAPTTSEAPDQFVQNPVTGVCTQSTSQWTAGLAGQIPCTSDDRVNEATSGGASYTTPPLTTPLRFDGPILADLWVSTTAKDAVATVRVTDVAPDGSSTELTDGWLAASFRKVDPTRSRYVGGQLLQPWHPFTRDSVLPVPAGQPVEMQVEVFPTNAMIAPGRSLRIDVEGGDFPHASPTLPMFANELGGVVNVLHDPQHPSYVALPTLGTTAHNMPVPNLTRG
ncbi:MAG TPA: CocE/NonD family hydrolase [Thermoleophilaceae bacterium]